MGNLLEVLGFPMGNYSMCRRFFFASVSDREFPQNIRSNRLFDVLRARMI